MEHLRPNSIHNAEHHFGSILRRIDMNTEGTLAERRVHGELESCLNTALYRPKFKLVGFAVNLRTQYSSFV